MREIASFRPLLGLCLSSFLLAGCASVNGYVAHMKPLPVMPDTDQQGPTQDSPVGGEILHQTPEHASLSTDLLTLFDPHTGVLWPGSLIQGKTLQSGLLSDLAPRRRPIEVFVEGAYDLNYDVLAPRVDKAHLSTDRAYHSGGRISREQGTLNAKAPARIYRTINDPTAGNIDQARREIIDSLPHVPVRIDFMERQTWSFEQAMFSLSASASWPSGSLRASLSNNQQQQQTAVMVELNQQYYTFALSKPFDPPKNAFGRGVTVGDLKRSSDTLGNPLTFVRSVTYGKMALLTASSTARYDDLAASVSASMSAAVGSGNIDYSKSEYKAFLNSDVKLWVYGGPFHSDTAIVLSGKMMDQLRQYFGVGAGDDIRTGVPISFRLDYLKDRTVAKLGLAVDYVRSERTLAPQLLDPAIGFAVGSNDKDDNTTVIVALRNATSGEMVAQTSLGDRTHWDDGSTIDPVPFPLQHFLLAADVKNTYLDVCIAPSGNDEVDFRDITLVAHRADNSLYEVHFGAANVDQDHRCVSWLLRGY